LIEKYAIANHNNPRCHKTPLAQGFRPCASRQRRRLPSKTLEQVARRQRLRIDGDAVERRREVLLDQLRQAADNDDTARNVIEFVIAQDCRLFEMTVSSGVSRLVEPSLASPADAARETRHARPSG
jgi:hypothetical protein